MKLIISCEHGVNTLPPVYEKYFTSHNALLHTHRAIDFGALSLAKQLSQFFNCRLVQAQTTRLLIDCNRSLSHRDCFSEISSGLLADEKKQIIAEYYLPFRREVEAIIQDTIKQGQQILHLSIHSFVANYNGILRNADIGFLYDPKRENEKQLAKRWQHQLKKNQSKLRVRFNYPYLGISDGFTTALRKQFAANDYLGIEVESNQDLIADEKNLPRVANQLAMTLKELILDRKAKPSSLRTT